jgi:hypothetical protein
MLLNSGMTKVNIDQLSEEELIELNHKIVARLRFLRQVQSHAQMLDYRIGERVRFYPAGQPEVTGTLTRYNKKSVTVITDSGQHWNVHPGLLHKMQSDKAEKNPGKEPIVMFPRSTLNKSTR